MDLVAKERKNILDSLADTGKVNLGLESRLRYQMEMASSAISSGIDHLKVVKALSDDKAAGYNKHIKSLKLQHLTSVATLRQWIRLSFPT